MTLAVGGAVTTLLGFVIVALAAYWVYRDAKTKGVSDPAGWGILTFLLFIIAFPLYLLGAENELLPNLNRSLLQQRSDSALNVEWNYLLTFDFVRVVEKKPVKPLNEFNEV